MMLSRYRRQLHEQLGDLPVLALLHCALLALCLVVAKGLAVRVAFSEAGVLQQAATTLRVLADDVVFVAACLVVTAFSRLGPALPPPARRAAAAFVVLTTQFLLAASFINVELFGSWASTLSWELLQLAPNLAGYILLVGVSNSYGALTIWAVLAIATLLAAPLAASWLRPAAIRDGRWHPAV